MGEWRPIESAPKDGTWIVGLCPESIQQSDGPKPFVLTTRWVSRTEKRTEWNGEWSREVKADASYWDGWENPTHWMPLPEPPK